MLLAFYMYDFSHFFLISTCTYSTFTSVQYKVYQNKGIDYKLLIISELLISLHLGFQLASVKWICKFSFIHVHSETYK